MNYGLYLSATGTLTSLHRQDIFAGNLANVETPGFMPDQVFTRQRLPERLEDAGVFTEPQWLLERLGGGHVAGPTRTMFRQGSLDRSENPLDLAIEGRGFFVASDRSGGDPEHLRFTRDGRLTIDEDGFLVAASSGLRVLDVNDQPIVMAHRGPVTVQSDGTVQRHGRPVARIQIVDVDLRHLVKTGRNLLRFGDDAPTVRRPAAGVVHQGFIESSAVDPIMTLKDLIGATKAAQANAKLMQYHDFIMGQAINTLGRVA